MKLKVFITSLLISFCFLNSLKAQKIDPDFSLPTPITSADIRAIRVQDDGKILIGGNIQFFESEKVNTLIRLNADGTLDETFAYDSTGTVKDIELQSNGKVVINSLNKLIQLNSSGEIINYIDTINTITSFLIQPDDKIIVVGTRKNNNTTLVPVMYRFNSDLTPDASFKQDNSFDNYILDVALQGDNIILSGMFSEINEIEKNDLARFLSSGILDESFDVGSGTYNQINAITVQQNGKILLGHCYLNSFNGDNSIEPFIRLTKDGDVDNTFQTPSNITGPVTEIFIHDSTIYYCAPHHFSADSAGIFLFRLDSLGNHDESFVPIELYNDYWSLILEFTPDDKILTDALSLKGKGNPFGLSKYERNGECVESFSPEIGCYGSYKTGFYHEGNIFVGGNFLKLGDIKTSKLGLVNQDGSVDPNFVFDVTFNVKGFPSQIKKINEDIFVAMKNAIYKLNSNGEPDPTFETQAIVDQGDFVENFVMLEDGKILISSMNGIYRLNSDGTIDSNFNIPDFNGGSTSNGMAITSSGILYHSGFSEVNGLYLNDFVRLYNDGTVDQSFVPNYSEDFDIYHMDLFENEEILLLDYFNAKVLKLSKNGLVDTDFKTNYETTAPENLTPYSSINFKDGFVISGWTYNGSSVYSLNFIDTTGVFDNNFSLPEEITDTKGLITPIYKENKELIVFSEFYLDGKTEPKFGLKLIVNDIPEITGIVDEIAVSKDSSFDINLEDLIVVDSDNSFPEDFTLNIHDGDNFTVNNNTVTPTSGFAGILSIPVSVNDGIDNSPEYNVSVEVMNETPEITGTTKDFSTLMNTPITILLTDLTVTDSDNSYPDDFTLNIYSGSNYSFENHTITPDNNFVGTLTVPLYVNDGNDDSPVYNIEIEVSQASGVNEIANKRDITIFPNPTTNEFNISFTNNYKGEVSVRLINLNGNLIKETHYQKTSDIFNKTISISDIKTGIYIIEVEVSENSRIQERIIVN